MHAFELLPSPSHCTVVLFDAVRQCVSPMAYQGTPGAREDVSLRWSPKLVDDLLFRQFCKNEDITASMPPVPEMQAPIELDDTLRSLVRFVQTGPVAITNNANMQLGGKLQTATPAKMAPPPLVAPSSTPRTPNAKPPLSANRNANILNGAPTATQTGPATKPKEPSPTTAPVARPAPLVGDVSKKRRREKIEWPQSVPVDAALKSKSRTAVEHLTEARCAAQSCVDPDLFFAQPPGEFPVMQVFGRFPEIKKMVSEIRTLSGDWLKDTFSAEEEREYKAAMGLTVIGPSQVFPVSALSRPGL